jgi:hypothetical protein
MSVLTSVLPDTSVSPIAPDQISHPPSAASNAAVKLAG